MFFKEITDLSSMSLIKLAFFHLAAQLLLVYFFDIMVKKENKLSMCSVTVQRIVVFTVSVEELLNNINSGVYDNEPVVLSEYGTLERFLELPEDNHSRRFLEWKISHGEILFLNEEQKMKYTQSLRELSPRKNNSGFLLYSIMIFR